jgi:hypothetical protein
MKKLLTLFLLITTLVLNLKAELLDFEGIADHTSVADFYLSNYQITFDSQAAAYTQSAGTRPFLNPPSPETMVYSTSTFNMTKSSGFADVLSFYYSNNSDAVITIYDASGVALATKTISPTGNPTPPEAPNSWEHVTIPFSGTATRVEFAGDTLYDNIYLGSVDVPALSSFFKMLLMLLLAGVSLKHLYRRDT